MSSLPNTVQSKEVRTLDAIRRAPAKASLESPPQSTPVEADLLHRLSSIVESALTAAHGSQKAASIEVGCDQSQMKRQLRIGTFDLRQMAAGGEAFLAQLGADLNDTFGGVRKSKKQIAMERLPELFALILDATEEP